jgi:hypothetical protein
VPWKGVIGLAYPKFVETLAIAGEKLIQGVKQERFAETAGAGKKKVSLLRLNKPINVLGLIGVQ